MNPDVYEVALGTWLLHPKELSRGAHIMSGFAKSQRLWKPSHSQQLRVKSQGQGHPILGQQQPPLPHATSHCRQSQVICLPREMTAVQASWEVVPQLESPHAFLENPSWRWEPIKARGRAGTEMQAT